jgi:hypothetical protein
MAQSQLDGDAADQAAAAQTMMALYVCQPDDLGRSLSMRAD